MTQQSVFYYNYKEPLIPVNGGYGYYGTLAGDEGKTKIQCHICGKMFSALTRHIITHGLTTKEYKTKFRLASETALVSDQLREQRIESYKNRPYPWDNAEHKARAMANLAKGRGRASVMKGRRHSLEEKNKRGTCPDQLLDRIRALKKTNPTTTDYKKKFGMQFLGSILRTFGTWNRAVRLAGFIPGQKGPKRTHKELVVKELKNFYEVHKRTPVSSDFKRGDFSASVVTVQKMFGTLNKARLSAGIPILVRAKGRKWKEIKP